MGWARCLGGMRPPKTPCFHVTVSNSRTVAVSPPFPARFWPNPTDVVQKSAGHGPGDCPKQLDKATWFWGATGICRGAKKEGCFTSNPAQTSAGQRFHGSLPAGTEFELLWCSRHLQGWTMTQSHPIPTPGWLPKHVLTLTVTIPRAPICSSGNYGIRHLELWFLGIFFPLPFCSLSEHPQAVSLSQAPWQGLS